MLRAKNAGVGTWYHSIGGPSRGEPYTVKIQDNKQFDSHGIESREYLGTIHPGDVKKVEAAAKRAPAQQCQTYVVSPVAELENRGLLPYGHAERLYEHVQMSSADRDYERDHPVPKPAITPGSSSRVPVPPVALRSAQSSSQVDSQYVPDEMSSAMHQQHSNPPYQAQNQPPPQADQQFPQPQQREDSDCCCIIM